MRIRALRATVPAALGSNGWVQIDVREDLLADGEGPLWHIANPNPRWADALGWLYWKLPFRVRCRVPAIRGRWAVCVRTDHGGSASVLWSRRQAQAFAAGLQRATNDPDTHIFLEHRPRRLPLPGNRPQAPQRAVSPPLNQDRFEGRGATDG